LNETDSGRLSHAVDWVSILAGCLVSSIIALVERLIVSRIRALNIATLKRRLLTGFGVVYVSYSIIVIFAMILALANRMGQPGLLSVIGVGTCLAFYFGTNVIVGLPLLVLRYAARRWDPGHWVFRMSNEILMYGLNKSAETVGTLRRGPSYIQAFRTAFPLLGST
jgi:hypothetical protein